MDNDPHFYGQGEIHLAPIDATTGVVGKFEWVGDVSALTLKPTSDTVQHKESHTGARGLTDDFPVGAALEIDMTMHQFSPENLARVLRGSVVNTVAGTVTAEALPDALVSGDEIYLANPGVSALVLTDSTPTTPKQLVAGTDYNLVGNPGRVAFIGDLSGFIQPFQAAYSYQARNAVGFMTTGQQKFAMKYEGVNLAEGNAATLVDIYKLAGGIAQQLELITSGTDVAGMQVTGAALLDTSKPSTGALGQFGSITTLVAA